MIVKNRIWGFVGNICFGVAWSQKVLFTKCLYVYQHYMIGFHHIHKTIFLNWANKDAREEVLKIFEN